MNAPNQNSADARLSSLFREARPAPALPPRFQENVWHRIEQGGPAASPVNWVEALAALVFKPRLAFAATAALVLTGLILGSLDGTTHARQDAQERYLAAVAIHAAP